MTSGLLDPMSSPVPGPQVAGSPAGSGVAAQDVPAPALTPEEEFDLFGPPDDRAPFVGAAASGAASAVAKASAPLPGTTYVGPQVAVGLDQNRRVAEKSAGDVAPEPSSYAKHGE